MNECVGDAAQENSRHAGPSVARHHDVGYGLLADLLGKRVSNGSDQSACGYDSQQRARELYPEIAGKNEQPMRAYREMSDEELFESQWVRVRIGPEDLPGYKAPRVVCAQCGEGINFKREVTRDGRTLCRACAGEHYEP